MNYARFNLDAGSLAVCFYFDDKMAWKTGTQFFATSSIFFLLNESPENKTVHTNFNGILMKTKTFVQPANVPFSSHE